MLLGKASFGKVRKEVNGEGEADDPPVPRFDSAVEKKSDGSQ